MNVFFAAEHSPIAGALPQRSRWTAIF